MSQPELEEVPRADIDRIVGTGRKLECKPSASWPQIVSSLNAGERALWVVRFRGTSAMYIADGQELESARDTGQRIFGQLDDIVTLYAIPA